MQSAVTPNMLKLHQLSGSADSATSKLGKSALVLLSSKYLFLPLYFWNESEQVIALDDPT
jgi:hypothetical protein